MGIHKDLKAGAAAVLLALIMAVQLVYTVGMFNSKKTFHTDEMWSYGLANSDGRPFLFMQPHIGLSHHQGQRMYNFDKWVDGSYYKDYLVVKENERFRYDTVIYNQTLDMHPPLYYSILHTICSFFPEQFSWYFGLSINLVSLCITQIFLYLLAYELTRRRAASLIVCAVYAASRSALFVFIFIRQYAMLTAWCTALTYFTAKLVLSDFNFKRYLAPAALCLFLGGLTQQLILIYAGGLTFCICLYLLLKKRIKNMLIYGLSMSAVVLFYMGIWPYALNSAKEYNIQHIYGYWVEVRIFLRYIFINTFGITSPIDPIISRMPMFILAGIILAAVLAVAFLFRNEVWFKRFLRIIRVRVRRSVRLAGKRGVIALSIVGGCMVLVLIAARVSSIVLMGTYGMRYIIYVIPVFAAAVIYLFERVCRFFIKNRRISAAVCICAAVVVCAASNLFGSDFLNIKEDTVSHNEVRQMLAGKKVILSLTDAANLQSYPEYFMDTDKVYVAMAPSVLKKTNYFDEVKNNDTFYVVVNGAYVIWEEDMRRLAEMVEYIPDDADKEKMISLSVQFCDDYMKVFESQDFIESAEVVEYTYNNGYTMAIFEVKTKK